jgi:succinoglycan biosynthesis protein ExoA
MPSQSQHVVLVHVEGSEDHSPISLSPPARKFKIHSSALIAKGGVGAGGGKNREHRLAKNGALLFARKTLASSTVNDRLPTVTVIIAARPDMAEVRALAAARQLDYPPERLEIILARGRQPSVQRNAALRAAAGQIIYFLDDDSMALPENLRRGVSSFAPADVKMVGGPSLCPPDAPGLEQAFALTMGAWLAFGPSCARYRKVGRPRETSEKELILCNLLARREALMELGGFNEKLYPNEENALMDELQKRGGKLLYDPELIVYRRPRPTLRAFCRMLLNYGRGRAEQFRLHPTIRSAPNFVPPLFCLFLILLPFLPHVCCWVLAAYGAAVLVQALAIVPWKKLHWFPGIAGLIFVSHVFYGLGFWRGCLTKPKPPPATVAAEVKLEKVRSFGN